MPLRPAVCGVLSVVIAAGMAAAAPVALRRGWGRFCRLVLSGARLPHFSRGNKKPDSSGLFNASAFAFLWLCGAGCDAGAVDCRGRRLSCIGGAFPWALFLVFLFRGIAGGGVGSTLFQ